MKTEVMCRDVRITYYEKKQILVIAFPWDGHCDHVYTYEGLRKEQYVAIVAKVIDTHRRGMKDINEKNKCSK